MSSIVLFLAGMQTVSTSLPPARLTCAQVDAAIEAARAEPLPVPRIARDVQFSAHHSLCAGWEIVDVWQTYESGRTVWHARRKQMSRSGDLVTASTDSNACPAIIASLTALERVKVDLTVIAPDVPNGARVVPPPPPPEDGTTFGLRLLSARQRDGSTAQVRVSSSIGPLARWAETELPRLASCWRTHPVAIGPDAAGEP